MGSPRHDQIQAKSNDLKSEWDGFRAARKGAKVQIEKYPPLAERTSLRGRGWDGVEVGGTPTAWPGLPAASGHKEKLTRREGELKARRAEFDEECRQPGWQMDPRSTYKPGVHGPPVFLEKVGGPPVWWTPSFFGNGVDGPPGWWTPG